MEEEQAIFRFLCKILLCLGNSVPRHLQHHIQQNYEIWGKCHSVYRVSQKSNKRLSDHRTNGFCSITNFAFDLNSKHSNLDFDTKFAQIRYEFIEIHQFQKCEVDFNFENFVDFRGIDFHNTCALNDMPL